MSELGYKRKGQDSICATLQLITDKPVLYVCNDEASASQGNNYVEIVKEFVNSEN